jgi:hypothetical protein
MPTRYDTIRHIAMLVLQQATTLGLADHVIATDGVDSWELRDPNRSLGRSLLFACTEADIASFESEVSDRESEVSERAFKATLPDRLLAMFNPCAVGM